MDLSLQCFHVVILRNTEIRYVAYCQGIAANCKRVLHKRVFCGYISKHHTRSRANLKAKVSFYAWYFRCFCIHFTQGNKHRPTFKNKCKASLLIVVFIWNRNWILMLERPLSHYWTSPINSIRWISTFNNNLFVNALKENYFTHKLKSSSQTFFFSCLFL